MQRERDFASQMDTETTILVMTSEETFRECTDGAPEAKIA